MAAHDATGTVLMREHERLERMFETSITTPTERSMDGARLADEVVEALMTVTMGDPLPARRSDDPTRG